VISRLIYQLTLLLCANTDKSFANGGVTIDTAIMEALVSTHDFQLPVAVVCFHGLCDEFVPKNLGPLNDEWSRLRRGLTHASF
jgi:hypothetical protein